MAGTLAELKEKSKARKAPKPRRIFPIKGTIGEYMAQKEYETNLNSQIQNIVQSIPGSDYGSIMDDAGNEV